jgi:transcriptional regulator with XRE-family HTH domain
MEKITGKNCYGEVGGRLREMRLKLGITQAEMAAKLGVSLPMLQNYESGKHLVSSSALIIIAKQKYADIEWLLCGDQAGLDWWTETMKNIIEGVETQLEVRQWTMPPDKKASIVYKFLNDSRKYGAFDDQDLKFAVEMAHSTRNNK